MEMFPDGHSVNTVATWLVLRIMVHNWATTWQNQQNECAPSEDSDQPGHSHSLIRVFTVRMKKAWVLSYQLSTQWWLIRLGGCPGWSESLLGAHSFCFFCHEVAHIFTILKTYFSILLLGPVQYFAQTSADIDTTCSKTCVGEYRNDHKYSDRQVWTLSHLSAHVVNRLLPENRKTIPNLKKCNPPDFKFYPNKTPV